MRPGPATDADVPAWWRGLGLPGIIDIHVHFMPERLLTRVWEYFEAAGPLVARRWPVAYRLAESERLARLRALGVRAFPSLLYPHKPGMAAGLNAWATRFAAATPDCLPSATFFPEPEAAEYVAAALATGARVFKAHVQVGGYDPRDPLLDPVWGVLAEAGVPVVVHCGSGPAPGRFTGPKPFAAVLARHPRLVAVIAHLGAPEYDEFAAIAARYDAVRLDTTMTFTDFFEKIAPVPKRLLPLLGDLGLGGKILFGSDFPNIPHSYAEALAALVRLDLGDAWMRAVCHDNGARLLHLEAYHETPPPL